MDCPLVLADPSQCQSNGNPLGLPPDPSPNYMPVGLGSTSAANPPSAFMSSVQGAWEQTESMYAGLYQGAKSIIGTVYDDVSSGVGTVYTDVSKPITSALTGTYWYLLLGVGALGVILVLTARSGAVKVSV